jgi:hypothetical protein
MRRSVTFSAAVKALSGTFQLVSRSLTLPSSDRRPASTRCSAPSADTGLLIEPAWNRVAGVTGARVESSATP